MRLIGVPASVGLGVGAVAGEVAVLTPGVELLAEPLGVMDGRTRRSRKVEGDLRPICGR